MKNKVIVVMPAYYAEKTLAQTYKTIPRQSISEVILVDDASTDKTIKVAKNLKITSFQHSQNIGYGGNQKTCYWEALKRKPDIVVMLHPDYQYDGSYIEDLIIPIIKKRYDVMLGSRITTRKEVLEGGMPLYKYFSNRLLTLLENIFLGESLSEWHTGFRAFKRKVLETVPFQRFSNDFIFDQQILISAKSYGFKLGEIKVPCRYLTESSSINFFRSVKYGLETLLLLGSYTLHTLGIISSKYFKE